ncbi:MAG: hypothetical protein EOR30_16755 [Mesorhizobium sp.]|nr:MULTISPECIES: hypothetical protein [unclassified Mesorhizobium]RUV75979.1 hypothetical protein EOA78_05100 [Mesorhizobium sp. M5C.F.Cr.IN.023.01.1.1]RWI39933.1 MAG: hypothetical protein EOR14_17830 [Mesorhizobium sp.]RWI45202.1 MAG: hypothetical protein EOR15_22210 [Mesorhizobium sp.]RWI54153.1 MAG: hypothetical protein EOR16_25060 [Mesorhizobium sp.]RWI65816.1 MAG: hypothetical protein EOR17_21625 [Mesorhizobium sp.]
MAEKRLLERRTVDFSPLNVGARCRKSMVLLTVLDSGVRKTHSPLPQPCGVPPRVTPRRFDRLAHPAYLP